MYKLLVVDDDEDFLNLLVLLLKPAFEVDTAMNGETALQKIESEHYDAIILDVALPDYTGYFVAKKMRTADINLPIAFLTNYNGDITKGNAKDVEATFWFKPTLIGEPDTVCDKVKELIENEKAY